VIGKTNTEAIMASLILERLRDEILPKHYRQNLQHKVDSDCLLFKKGSYVALAMPFSRVPEGDYGNDYAKGIVRGALTCIPFFFEKGLFLIYYGDKQKWGQCWTRFEVDVTGLRPVILQSIHFIDPQTGENENTRTQWGPIKFGFCGKLIADLEELGKSLAWNNAFSPSS
jgi:hypothetical protein